MSRVKRKKFKFNIAFCIILFCSVVCFTGCQAVREFQSDPLYMGRAEEKSSQEFVDYMEGKYGGEFTYIKHFQTAGLFSESSACYVSSDSYPDAYIRVEKAKSDGGYAFKDGFLSARYRDALVDLAESVNNEAFGARTKVAVRTDGTQFSPEGCSAAASLDDFIDKGIIELTFYFDAGQIYDHDADTDAIVSSLAAKNIRAYAKVYYLDTTQFATVPNHQDLIDGEADVVSFENPIEYGAVYMNAARDIDKVTWY